MKICPMCGSDILGGNVKTCTSCGADLTAAGKPRHNPRDDQNAPPASSGYNDAPIAKSDDLEVVSPGAAFWTESRPDGEPTDRVNSQESAEDTELEDDTEPSPPPRPNPIIATATKPNTYAPSLADLARMRKERLAQEQKEAEEAQEPVEETEAADETAATVESADAEVATPDENEAVEEAPEVKDEAQVEEPEVPEAEGTVAEAKSEVPDDATEAEPDARGDLDATSRVETGRAEAETESEGTDSVPTLAGLTSHIDAPVTTPKSEKPESETTEASQTEPKAEPESRPRAETQTESTAEPESEPRAETQTEPKAEPQSKPKAESQAESKAESQTKSEAEPQTKPKAEVPTKPQVEPEEGSHVESEAEPASEPEPEMEAAPKSEKRSAVAPKPKPRPMPEMKPVLKSTTPKPDAVPTAVTDNESATADESDQAIKVVTRAPQIAYFDGSTLTIPGAHLKSGEKVLVSGRPYELKRQLSKGWLTRERMMVGGGGLIAGILLSLIVSAFGGGSGSELYGIVRDGKTGKLLPGVTISVDELNRTVQSDQLGMFRIDGLEEGVYTLSGSDPIYGVVESQATLAGDQTSVVLDLGPPAKKTAAPKPRTPPKQVKKTSSRKSADAAAAKARSPGKIAIAASVNNAQIYLDGQLLGVGNGVYDRIKPGDHKLSVRRSGYDSWVEHITVKGGETVRFEPVLAQQNFMAAKLTPEQHYQKGRKAYDAKDYGAALSEFSAALDVETLPHYLAWRAETNLKLGDRTHAERDFLDAIEAYDHDKNYKRADRLVDHAVQEMSSSAALWMARADYEYRRRKPMDAVKSYRKAMDLGADKTKAWIGIGLAEYSRGNFDAASEAWDTADKRTNLTNARIAGYLALASAWLQYRTSCRSYVRRVEEKPAILKQFRAHPDWSKVQRLTGAG